MTSERPIFNSKLVAGKWIPCLLFLGHLLIAAPWIYKGGAGEPDSLAMINGVYQGALQQTWFNGSLYMLIGQPFYYAIYFLLQRLCNFSYDQLALAMNISATMCSAGTTVLIYLLARQIAGWAGAVFAAILYVSSPTVFEYSTYTHPVTLSLFLLLLGVYFASKSQQAMQNGPRLMWLLLAVLSAGAAMGSRADVIILFHLFLLFPVLMARQNAGPFAWRQVITGAGVAVAAGVIGITGIASVNTQHGISTDAGIVPKLAGLVKSFFNLMPLHDGLLELVFGVGVAGSILILVCLALPRSKQSWLTLGLVLLLVVPPLVFAMGNSQPARRFLHAVLATTFVSALLWEQLPVWRLKRWGALVAIGAVGINLITLPAFGRMLTGNGIDVKSHSLLHRAVSSIMEHHHTNQQYLYRVERQMQHLRNSAQENSLLIGGFVNMYFLMASFSKDARPAQATFPEQRTGFVLGKLTSGDDHFLLAEYHRGAKFSMPASITHIYKLGELVPEDLPTTIPLTDLTPRPEDSFQMWFRPYFGPEG